MSTAIAGLKRSRAKRRRHTVCNRCHEGLSAVLVEVKILEKGGNGRSGTTAARSLTVCEKCGLELFGILAAQIESQ